MQKNKNVNSVEDGADKNSNKDNEIQFYIYVHLDS